MLHIIPDDVVEPTRWIGWGTRIIPPVPGLHPVGAIAAPLIERSAALFHIVPDDMVEPRIPSVLHPSPAAIDEKGPHWAGLLVDGWGTRIRT